MRLHGKTILITGASSGIGAETARLCAAAGANVVLGARRGERLAALSEEITAAGGAAAYAPGDMRSAAYAAELVALAQSRFGGLDGAFNNAGITGTLGPLAEMAEDTWREVIETNLTSGFHAAKAQIPALQQRGGGGALVFTSSFVGHTIGLPGMAAYAASKAGLIGMTQALATELGPQNIRVNALLPGGTMTEMAGEDRTFHETVAAMHALKRMAAPAEIARAALFLLSDDASFVTGSAMLADGGNSITKL
ncbi:SDR family oxidoreductase [Salipiger sp. PrR002]|uniref:SDR family oxidoreductase n=1 Tax=Salipiger sp. PrR002 TaxID=2706489 RepID=UPI0013BDF32E|nr:SDR family oxidoreductase [Salipiger sp. PrR002]NDV97933.1 SDR family oxidoreductase [Salipiger sp. PrR002]NDW55424.1 SDR family oxidoreductase [Salipiger sp. PrR004]